MKIAVLTLCDPRFRALGELTAPNLLSYCHDHGYTFIAGTRTLTPGWPTSWSKLCLLQEHLHSFDWLLWVDADALVARPETPLEKFLDVDLDVNLIFPTESTGEAAVWRGLWACAFLVRNCHWTDWFLEEAFGRGGPKVPRPWEQGAMRDVLRSLNAHALEFTRYLLRGELACCADRFEEEGDLFVHFGGGLGSKITRMEDWLARDNLIRLPRLMERAQTFEKLVTKRRSAGDEGAFEKARRKR